MHFSSLFTEAEHIHELARERSVPQRTPTKLRHRLTLKQQSPTGNTHVIYRIWHTRVVPPAPPDSEHNEQDTFQTSFSAPPRKYQKTLSTPTHALILQYIDQRTKLAKPDMGRKLATQKIGMQMQITHTNV